jgi:acyl carrier protein
MSVKQATTLTVEDAVAAVNSVVSKKRGAAHTIDASARLEELRLSSLDIAEVLVTLEEAAGCELDPESARDLEVVGDLVALQPL